MSQQPRALKDNLHLYDKVMAENTAKVIAPSAIAPMGKVVINLGESRPDSGLVNRDLLDAGGNFAVAATGTEVEHPLDAATQLIATDNQIIRLQDGSLLAVKNGYIWSDLSPRPKWFDTFSFTFYNGVTTGWGRSAIYLFRSTDAGQHWEQWSRIDSAVVADGKYGWPAQYTKKDGSLAMTIGGFDRTEVYQDPWTGDIYVSSKGGGGPYPTKANPQVENHAGVIFRSRDNGKNWEAFYEIIDPPPGDHKWGFPMISTPNHRLVVFSVEGTRPNFQPTLHYVENGVMSEGKTFLAKDHGKELNYGAAADMGDIRGYPLCIAPSNSQGPRSSVWVAYPTLNASNVQTYVVATVSFGGSSEPTVTLAANVAAEDSTKTSATMGAFIYDDLVDPDDQNTDLSCVLFYWLEAQPTTSTDSNMANVLVRYQVFHSGQAFPPGNLSVQGGSKRYFKRTQNGDYFSGGYFWLNDELNFLAQWVEPGGIRANIVSLPPFPMINFYKELLNLIIQPYPDPKLRELIDVKLRGMSIAQRRGLVTRLKGIQNSINEVLQLLDEPSLTKDITESSL